MNEQEARAIEAQLIGFLPDCKVEAYGSEEPDYQTKQFVSTWRVAVYSSAKKLGNLVCVIRDHKHLDAFLSMCASYYDQRKEIEEDAYPIGKSFTDQNGKTVIHGYTYTAEEYEQL